MVQGEFETAEGTKAVGFSHSDFGFVVQALDDAAGKQFLSSKVIENEFAVFAQRTGDLFHGLDAGPHDLAAPMVEELPGPPRGVVIPELLKGFLEKVGANGLQVITEQIAKPEALFGFQILFAFEQQPARLLQQRHESFARHAARFSGADFIESLVHFGDDMEAVEDMKGLRALFADDLQIGLPHIGTDEGNLGSDLIADDGEESAERFNGSFPANPEEARKAEIDLIDQRQILVPFGVLNLVHADGVDLSEYPVLQPEGDHVFDGVKDLFP